MDDDRPASSEVFPADGERDELERRRAAVEAGRRRGGLAGAALAGAMTVVSEIVEGPKKEETPVVIEASGDPHDLERDGLTVDLGDVTVDAPALDHVDTVTERNRRGRPPVV